jgi:PA14 domain/Glycosyl hydrolases family 2, TIM barrel domain
MYAKNIVLFILIALLVNTSTIAATDILLAGYETSETNLTITSPDGVTTLQSVQGGVGSVPAATEGSYVLQLTWANETDGKVEIKHQWTNFTFDLLNKDRILVDVYMTSELSPTLMGVWDYVWGWHQSICVPPVANEWYTISFDVTDCDNINLNSIGAIVVEGMPVSSGTLYIDNLRLSSGLPVDTTVEIQGDWFYVNGEKFFVKGVCFFEWDPTGERSSLEVLDYKFRKIKEAGFNTIRSWLQPDELELARQHGLMVMQGANYLCFSHEYEDREVIESFKTNTEDVVSYSSPYNNILFYIIDNEPHIHSIYDQGEDAIISFYNELIDVARGVKPDIILSMASFPPVAFLDHSIFDCLSLNLYPFGPAENSLGYQKYLEWFKKEYAANKPFVISEYGWDFIRGEAEFSETMMGLLDKQLSAGATGSFFYTWQSFGEEGVGDNRWFGIIPKGSEMECYMNEPRAIYYDFKEYFEAILVNPKNNQQYTQTIPVEVYGSDNTHSVEALFEGQTYPLTQTGTYWWQCDIVLDGSLTGSKNITIYAKDETGNTLATKERTIIIGDQPKYTVNIVRNAGELAGCDTYNATVSVTDSNNNPVQAQALRLGLNETGKNVWGSTAIPAITNAQGKYDFSWPDISSGYLTLMAGIDSGLNEMLSSPSVDIVRVEMPPVSQGLKYDYYEGSWSSIPDFESLTAIKSGQITNFLLTPKNRDDDFAMRFTGYIYVPANGTYFFYTDSDDGSQLYINNTLVVDNDGLHGMDGDVEGSIVLQAGKHLIVVDYFEAAGGEDLKVSYAGPTINKQIVPGNVLSWCNLNGDLDNNCYVDISDLRIMAADWLNDYTFIGFAEIASDWLQTP